MPISPIVLQRRHAELGRIRLGDKQPTSNGRSRPNKLDRFRFTSPSQRYIADLAALYGGTAREWDNNGKTEWEVVTDATTIPVIAVKGGLSQWMETWSGGGCIHRCDGERQADGTPCDLDEPDHINAKPTTRLSVMLPELDAIGVWRLESHGWNAAAEIPAVAELATYVGDLVPADLHLVERRSVRDGKTSRYVVPVLDLRIGAARLREVVAAVSAGEQPATITAAPATAQIEQKPAARRRDWLADVLACGSLDALRDLWREANSAGVLEGKIGTAIDARRETLTAAGATPAGDTPPEPATPAAVASGDPDAIWQQVLSIAGQRGMSLDDTIDAFAKANAGLSPDTASAGELAAFLTILQSEDAA